MRRLTIAGIAVLGAILGALPGHADVQDELRGVNREIREKRILLKKTTKMESRVSTELDQIEKNLAAKEANLRGLTRDLQVIETTLGRTGKEIEDVKGEVEIHRAQIRQRLVALYKAGEMGSTRMFFSAESFPEVLETLRYMRSVLQHDRQLVDAYTAKIDRLRGLKGDLERDAARKESVRKRIEATTREIEEEKLKKVAALQKIKEERRTYQASLKELQENARRLQAMFERLEARSRKSYSKKSGSKPSVSEAPVQPPVPDKGFGALKGRLTIPVKGEIVGSFGRHKHPEFNSFTVSNGITIAAPAGADIHAVHEGQVIFADYFKGYGNMVIIDHGSGFFSLYAHANRLLKKTGTAVHRSEVIASVGDVDSPRGAMLYFEIRYQGKPVDPGPWFR